MKHQLLKKTFNINICSKKNDKFNVRYKVLVNKNNIVKGIQTVKNIKENIINKKKHEENSIINLKEINKYISELEISEKTDSIKKNYYSNYNLSDNNLCTLISDFECKLSINDNHNYIGFIIFKNNYYDIDNIKMRSCVSNYMFLKNNKYFQLFIKNNDILCILKDNYGLKSNNINDISLIKKIKNIEYYVVLIDNINLLNDGILSINVPESKNLYTWSLFINLYYPKEEYVYKSILSNNSIVLNKLLIPDIKNSESFNIKIKDIYSVLEYKFLSNKKNLCY